MRRRRREAPQLGVLALVALTATLLSVAARAGSAGDDAERVAASAWRGLVGAPRQEVAVGQRVIVVLNTPALVRPASHMPGAEPAKLSSGDGRQPRWPLPTS